MKAKLIMAIYETEGNVKRLARVGDTLAVEFLNGKTYTYFDVPDELAEEMVAAESTGAFLNRRIKGNYRYAQTNSFPDVKTLLHHKDTTVGLWATDKPDAIPEERKDDFFRITA